MLPRYMLSHMPPLLKSTHKKPDMCYTTQLKTTTITKITLVAITAACSARHCIIWSPYDQAKYTPEQITPGCTNTATPGCTPTARTPSNLCSVQQGIAALTQLHPTHSPVNATALLSTTHSHTPTPTQHAATVPQCSGPQVETHPTTVPQTTGTTKPLLSKLHTATHASSLAATTSTDGLHLLNRVNAFQDRHT